MTDIKMEASAILDFGGSEFVIKRSISGIMIIIVIIIIIYLPKVHR